MAEKKPVEFKVLRKNSYGHRFILEPKERIKFREKCKYNKLGTLCEKGYKCYACSDRSGKVIDAVVIGCTENVVCPRMARWDKQHGLEKPYTFVENKFPDLKTTSFVWHPSVESPGKRRVVMAFVVKGQPKNHFYFKEVRFLSPNVVPATCVFKNDEGTKMLAVAWAYYDEVTSDIADWMISRAEYEAWAWWPDKE